jgi:serine/threonine-protein kinase RsbW
VDGAVVLVAKRSGRLPNRVRSGPTSAVASRSWREYSVVEVRLPSEIGWERTAMAIVASAARRVGFPHDRVEDLKTAVSEATLNAIEHGNAMEPSRPVSVRIVLGGGRLEVSIRDRSVTPFPPAAVEAPPPSLVDRLKGHTATRGWGMFLIKSLVDEVEFSSTRTGNRVRMVLYRDYRDPDPRRLEAPSRVGGSRGGRPA